MRAALSHSASTTRPASFIPPTGNSRPYWLKVTLANFDTHSCAFEGLSSRERLATPRGFTITRASPVSQS